MSEIKMYPSPSSHSPLLNIKLLDPETIVKYRETNDPLTLIKIMNRLVSNTNHHHPHILSYKDFNMEYHPPYWNISFQAKRMNANLNEFLKSRHNESLSKPELLNCFYSLICALEYLHKKGLPHQNIKPENILFDSNQNAYLADCCHINEIKDSVNEKSSLNAFFIQNPNVTEKFDKARLYAEDLSALGLIFLRMCIPLCANKLNIVEETISQSLVMVREKYGEDLSDLLYQMTTAKLSEGIMTENIRKNFESRNSGLLRPLSFNEKQLSLPENNSFSNENIFPFSLMNQPKVNSINKSLPQEDRISLKEEGKPRRKSEIIGLISKSYLFLPWRFTKSIKTICKYGILKKRDVTTLKKCFKLGSCQGLDKMGKKIGFGGLEIVQSNNGRTRPNLRQRDNTKVQQLSKHLSTFQNLKDLQVEFTCDNITCKDLTTLGKNILKLKQLKKFRISFACGQAICDTGLLLLGQIIQRLRSLENLNVHLNRWGKISDKGFSQFCHGLSKLGKLKHLTLCIEEFLQIGSNSIEILGQSLVKLPLLAEIDLTFLLCPNISGAQLDILSGYIAKSRNLKKLAINMKQAQGCIDQGIVGLSKSIGSFIDLRELKLNFLSCDVSEASIISLGNSLSQLTRLQSLDLTFGNNNQMTNKSFESITVSIAEMTQLRNLKLVSFQCDKLGDGAICCLAEALAKVQNLSELELNFRWCIQISDYGISKLGEAFLNLKLLNTLKLSFDGCRLSDIGVSKLGQDLARIQYLSDLKLEVRECKRIQGVGISKLGECLTRLVELGQIQLNFCGCGGNYRQRFNEGIKSLRRSISKLPRVNVNDTSIAPSC